MRDCIRYNKRGNEMKKLLLISFLLVSVFNLHGQEWVSDKTYEEKIHEKSAFGDDEISIVVVEFWAKFNDINAFKDWNKVKGISNYYRCDVAVSPEAKKKYKIRMAPTILIFKDGVLEETFKAGLDLECPVDLEELQETIDEIKESSKF